MTLVQIKNNTSTEYAQIVLCTKGAEFQPSRLTRPSDTPALQLGFIPAHLTGKSAQRTTRHLNYPEIEIIGARPVIKTPHKPELTPPSPREEPAEGEQAWRRKYRTLDHRRLSHRSSAVLSMAHQFERSEESALSKSVSLTRLASREVARKPARRTSVKEMAQLYDTMARDNSLDQLTQRDNSLSRSTSYIRNRALQQMTSDLTPIESTASSARGSPQPYMNVSLSPPVPPVPSALYENAGLLKRADPYEEVFFSRPNSQLQFRYQKIPETGELIQSDCSLSASSSHASQLEQCAEPNNLRADFSQSADLISEHTCQKLRATTIATVEREEEFSEELLGHFFLTYHWTEPAEGYTDITSKASRRLSCGQVSRGERVEASVYRTHVSLSGSSCLPPSLLLMDLIASQTDADHPDNLGMLVRAGTEFQLLFFSAPDSQSADQLISRLRDAASDCDRRASLISSGSDDHFALLLGCSPVSSGAGKVSLGVEQTLSSHRLSQSQQVRIDLQDGFQIFPFGRSESLCAYRRQQVKSAGVWERDPRVLGVVLQQRVGRHICYTLRFNRVDQLLASFSRIRHLCREDAAEESKKQRAGFLNLKGLFGKQTAKPRCHSDTSRSSTPPVDQMDPDAFTLLFLGATEPDNALLTPECVLREYKNLLAGINVAENVSPAPTTILTVSESCIRLTDKDKALFRRRVYQRRTVAGCERAEGENVLALLTQRPGTDEKKCSLFRPVFSEAGLVSAHICQRLELKALH